VSRPWSTSGPLSLPFAQFPCLCRVEHAPSVPWSHRHHIVPLYANGPDVESNIVHVCPATHDWIHVILREFDKAGEVRSRRQTWPHYAYRLAVTGFAGFVTTHPQ
ncbi:MAG: HNH endonuclease signature motif containing protein, partial [Ilumatobacteraceae bacterium]